MLIVNVCFVLIVFCHFFASTLTSIKYYELCKSTSYIFPLCDIKADNPKRQDRAQLANQYTGFASYCPQALPAIKELYTQAST